MHLVVCYTYWTTCVRIGLGWADDAISFAYHMFMHSPCIHTLFSIYLLYLNCFGTFLIVSLSLPLFLFTLVVSMTPKRKSTSSQNPFRFGASSSSDPTPSHIRFCDENARKYFSKNFSQQGVHSERRVILADFIDTDLPTVIHSQGWESLVHSCWSRSFTPTCMDSIFQYLSFLLVFEVHAL